jgi:acyl-coenzyme A thioesterase PaaI-like protein
MTDEPKPNGAKPDPEHEGWLSWGNSAPGTFVGATGKFIFRADGEGQARVRWFPDDSHVNIGGSIFGGAILSFIDMALFAGGRCAGMGEGHYVTLDCATHFIARGETNVAMDAVVRLVGETKGGLVFLSGHCEQGDRTTHSFTGTLKRVRARVADDAK